MNDAESFMFGDEPVIEACPECEYDNLVNLDGFSSCVMCGHKNIRPCSACVMLDRFQCDWSRLGGCSPFPGI